MRKFLRIASNIFIIAALCVIAFAAWNLYGILSNYNESNKEYEEARKSTTAAVAREPEKGPIDESWGFTPGDPLNVNFEELKEINPEIIAWIWVPGLDISYPVLQAKDNDKYLHSTYKGTYAYAGSIFADCLNTPDFFDRNTILYGHNMTNGSMFGKLRDYIDHAEPPFNPYVWIMTENANFCYRMFSSHISEDANETYSLFEDDDPSFVRWEEKMRDQSIVDYEDVLFTDKDHVLTLSTCHSDHVHRRVIHALMIYQSIPEDPGEDAITLE